MVDRRRRMSTSRWPRPRRRHSLAGREQRSGDGIGAWRADHERGRPVPRGLPLSGLAGRAVGRGAGAGAGAALRRPDRRRGARPHRAGLDRRVRLSRLAAAPGGGRDRRRGRRRPGAGAGRGRGDHHRRGGAPGARDAGDRRRRHPRGARGLLPARRGRRRGLLPRHRRGGRAAGRHLHQPQLPARRPVAGGDRAAEPCRTSAASRTPRPTPGGCSRSSTGSGTGSTSSPPRRTSRRR